MTLNDRITALRDKLERWSATPSECMDLISVCAAEKHFFAALHIADLAIVRFPTDSRLRRVAGDLLERLEAAGILGSLVDLLPENGEAIRKHRDRLAVQLAKHHGPDSSRPASDDFFQCVLLKNLCHTVPGSQPVRNLLMRIGDHHGRRAAGEAFGSTIGLPVMHDDRTTEITIADRTARFRISSGRVAFELLYFFTFEPGMIRWIAGFDPSDVFVDVGANIGKYSVLAALTRGCRTYAFEPFTPNHRELLEHIALNGLGDRIVAKQAALSDRSEIGALSYAKETIGAAAQTFDETVDEGVSTERVHGYRLDDLVSQGAIDFPNHVKIDVDGTEHRVIAGMETILSDPRLKSIRLEIRLADPRNAEALQKIEDAGFDCAVDDDEKNLLCRRTGR